MFVFLLSYANEMRSDPCIIRTENLKVNFRGKKCVLYTGKYGNIKLDGLGIRLVNNSVQLYVSGNNDVNLLQELLTRCH